MKISCKVLEGISYIGGKNRGKSGNDILVRKD